MIDEIEFMGTPMMDVCAAAPQTLWLYFLLGLFVHFILNLKLYFD